MFSLTVDDDDDDDDDGCQVVSSFSLAKPSMPSSKRRLMIVLSPMLIVTLCSSKGSVMILFLEIC